MFHWVLNTILTCSKLSLKILDKLGYKVQSQQKVTRTMSTTIELVPLLLTWNIFNITSSSHFHIFHLHFILTFPEQLYGKTNTSNCLLFQFHQWQTKAGRLQNRVLEKRQKKTETPPQMFLCEYCLRGAFLQRTSGDCFFSFKISYPVV